MLIFAVFKPDLAGSLSRSEKPWMFENILRACWAFDLGDNENHKGVRYATMHPVLGGLSVGSHTSTHTSPRHPHSPTGRPKSRIFAHPGHVLAKACGPIVVLSVVLSVEKVPVDVLVGDNGMI